MKPILFIDNRSPPVRSCLMLIKALQMDVEYKQIDLFSREHLTSEYKMINPAHTVPALQDGDLTLTDSHAILIYLASKYGPETNFYPNDEISRIQIINKLFFESSVLFRHDSDMMSEIFRTGLKDVTKHKAKLYDVYSMLEKFLGDSSYIASDNLTIADFSMVTTLSTVDLIFPVTADKWPQLHDWFQRMKTLAYYDVNETGLDNLKTALTSFASFNFEDTKDN